ncbi:MAG: hypothetical protein ACYDCS_14450 [Candidatus Dormibacteria bacterium]|nr:hypothetical protein [Candidatus Saccharimonadales bacterium]
MNGVLGALIGVPATMLVAGGLGIIGLSIYTRVIGTRRGRRPIHWGHVTLGTVMFGLGVLLLWIEVISFGAS